ncbi:MAG: LPS-assembly protein LptD [Deltaproteobacteria bacterium]|nr:LPS-assembly protein LptD [Deltaproteobacteria bacterium]
MTVHKPRISDFGFTTTPKSLGCRISDLNSAPTARAPGIPHSAFLLLLTVCCLLFLPPLLAFAEDGKSFSEKKPIAITADSLSYDKSKDTYYAEGHVIVIQGESSIKADKMIVDMSASHAHASGNVEIVDEGGDTLKGDSLDIDIDTKVGVAINGRLFFKKENVHVVGDEIKKTGAQSYSAHHSFFTTCDCEEGSSPAWSFYAQDTDVTLGKYIHAWNTFFYIKNVPVLYSPYVVFPVKTERETGFLMPSVGYSGVRGAIFDNSFFWAISDSADATFYLDIESLRGIGKGIEYRYALSKTTDGEFSFYHFQENDISRVREFRQGIDNLSRPMTATNDRWFLQYRHRGLLPHDVILKADIKRVSDDEYFIDFGKDIQERSLVSLESNVSMTKTWNKFNLVAQFRYFDNLLAADDSSTLQRLPEITLTGADQQVPDTPFNFSMESSFVNFEREKDYTGQRIDIHPAVSLPLNPGGYFELKPSAGIRETYYWVENNPLQEGYSDRSLYDLNLDLTTTFVKIYSWDENMEQARPILRMGAPVGVETNGNTVASVQKIKHTIRPKIVYTYIPELRQDSLPNFDAVDRIAATSTITYSLNTILTGKFIEGGNPSYRDYVYMDLSQSYDINEATRKLVSPADERRPFSAVTGEARLKPLSWTMIAAKGAYDVYNNWLNQYDASLGIWDRRGDRLDASYRYARSPLMEYLDASLRFKLIPSVDLTYHNRYSYNDNTILEAAYGLEYKRQCWNTQITYTERPEEKIVMVTFNLLGIGEVGGAGGKMQ